MPDLIFIVGLTVLILYAFIITAFAAGFLIQIKRKIHYSESNLPPISIIVPFRNEEANIDKLLNDLAQQNYPKEKYEVIFVNDHSRDRGEKKAKKKGSAVNNFSLLHLPMSKTGKKFALQYGISKAKHELICLTDADCRLKANFLKSMGMYRLQKQAQMIIAPVNFEAKGFWGKLQAAEFISLSTSAAGSAGIGFPVLSNGAGLLAKKKYFTDIELKEASGDDMFLMHAVKKDAGKIEFLLDKNALVKTAAPDTLKTFFAQRLRWVSKFKNYKDTETILAGLTVFQANFFLLAGTGACIFRPETCALFWYMVLLKIIPDTILMLSGMLFFRKLQLFVFYLLWIPIYPFYSVITAIAGQLSGKIVWKNRKISSRN